MGVNQTLNTYIIMDNYDKDKLSRARKRVDQLKGFYIHFAIYLAVNAFIIVNVLIRTLENGESFWNFGTFATAFFWGIGVAFHATKVFNLNPFLNKKWEERQIQKYIDKDKEEAEKYK